MPSVGAAATDACPFRSGDPTLPSRSAPRSRLRGSTFNIVAAGDLVEDSTRVVFQSSLQQLGPGCVGPQAQMRCDVPSDARGHNTDSTPCGLLDDVRRWPRGSTHQVMHLPTAHGGDLPSEPRGMSALPAEMTCPMSIVCIRGGEHPTGLPQWPHLAPPHRQTDAFLLHFTPSKTRNIQPRQIRPDLTERCPCRGRVSSTYGDEASAP